MDKVLHHDIDLEKQVLGEILLSRDACEEYLFQLKLEDFTDSNHQIVLVTMQKMEEQNVAVDLISLMTQLKSDNKLSAIGGMWFLSNLQEKATSTAHLGQHINMLKTMTVERKLLVYLSTAMSRLERNEDVYGIMTDHINHLNEVYVNNESNEHIITMKEAVFQVLDQMNENQKGDKELSGVPTGFAYLDKRTGGLQEGNLIVVAGESSQGKTSLALSIAYNAIRQGKSGAYYSMEMSSRELVSRIMAMNIERDSIKPSTLLYKKLDEEQYSAVMNKVSEVCQYKLYFDERTESSLEKILRSISIMKAKYKIDFAVVDYLQIMTAPSKGRTKEEQLAEITRKLKNIAIKEKIPIILLSQLARDRSNPEPTNSRLRGSGQIEEAADIVLLVYRPEVYGLQYSDEDFKDQRTFGTAELKISKGRNTGIFNILVGFNENQTRFYDLDKDDLETTSKYDEKPKIEMQSELDIYPF